MISKEALEKISWRYVNDPSFQEWCNIIKQDLNKLEKLEKENKMLREKTNHFKNVKNRYRRNEKFVEKENAKLKNIIKLLEDNFQLVLKQDIDPLLNRKIYAVEISKNYKIYSGFEITQEQYELLKDELGNKWYNKPLPAFAPEENYDYSFANDCLQKAEKYDCEGLEEENFKNE